MHYDEAVILPGFVNAHTHLEYDVYAGFGDGLGFADWIGLHVQRKQRIDLDDMEAIARLGALNCLRSGITTVGDCSFSGAAATACAELGLRGTIYLEVFGDDDAPIRERFEPMRERIADALSDDVRLGISPHAPYTCTIELYRACAELGLPVATHLAESDAETRVPAHRQRRLGVVRGDARAAARDDRHPRARRGRPPRLERDRRALRQGGRGGDRAPRRARRRGRALPALERDPRLRRRAAHARFGRPGIRVCIATDSPASTPSFDMFDEMRAAIVGARAREGRPDALTAADALELATLGGARALGLDDAVGSLVPGQAGGSDRALARGHVVHPVGRSCYGSGSRRIPSGRRRYSRVRQTAV